MATPEDDDPFAKAAKTLKRGAVTPTHIFWLQRREIDEDSVDDLVGVLRRDGQFIQPIALRAEEAGQYRLIAGLHRLEAWKRCFGEQRPIPATIYAPDTPDAVIEVLEIEENLLRKELTAVERQVQRLRLAAALKELDAEKPATAVSDWGEATETGKPIPSLAPARGGRGNKGIAHKTAEKAGVSKRAVNMSVQAASAAIGEKIDLDRDTPEELKRKADKRQHAVRLIRIPKRRKPAPHVVIEDPTPPAQIDSQIEALWEAFAAIGRRDRLRFIHDACLRLGLDPLQMATPAAFGLADEESKADVGVPAEVAPATDDAVAEQVEHGDEAALAQAKEEDEAALAQAGQGDDGVGSGAEDPQDASDHSSEVADEEPVLAEDLPAEVAPATDAADSGAEDLQDAGDDVCEAAGQEPGAAETCAYCNMEFLSGDQRYQINGRLYHDGFCLDYGKKIAIAAG